MSNCINKRKAAMIGCGFVGSASVYTLMEAGLFSEIVLIDADKDRAEGEAMDISHGIPFNRPMEIYAGSYDDISDADLIIVTAGAAQKPGETRLDLVHKNVKIIESIIPEITKRNSEAILLIVSNPVDILTYVSLKLSGYPENRVIGSGTVLDTGRFRYELSKHLKIDARSIHAYIIGEHGDSEFAAWSSAMVSGIPVSQVCYMRGFDHHEETEHEISERVKNSAYEIISKKHATYYGIASAVRRICSAIMRDERSVLPISSVMHGEYGIENMCLSMPAIVGADGFETRIPITLDLEEQSKLRSSADTLSKIIKEIGYDK